MSGLFQKMVAAWSAPVVARNEVSRFSGGILTARYLANLDSQGKGPRNRIRCGRKVCYPTADLAAWMESRTSQVEGRVGDES